MTRGKQILLAVLTAADMGVGYLIGAQRNELSVDLLVALIVGCAFGLGFFGMTVVLQSLPKIVCAWCGNDCHHSFVWLRTILPNQEVARESHVMCMECYKNGIAGDPQSHH